MNSCNCDSGLGNLGTPNCIPEFGIGRRAIFVPLIDSDGNRNSIDPAVEITNAFIEGKLNESDPSKRWFLTPEYKNKTSERAETEYEEYEDGSKDPLRKGIRVVSFMFPKRDTVFLSKLDQNSCVDMGVYIISDNGSIMGKSTKSDNLLYPIAIQAFDTNWNPKLDTATQKVMVSYEWKRSEYDSQIRFISSSEFSGDFDMYQGLLDVNATLVSSAVGTATVDLKIDYGSYGAELVHTGVVIGDITELYNVTTDTALTVDTVTESPDGTYVIAYSGVTNANDVLRLTITKNGFDYSQVKTVNIGY